MNKTTARLYYIKTKDSFSHQFPCASVAMVLFWTSKADFASSFWIRDLPKCFNKTGFSTVGSLQIEKKVKIKGEKRVCVNHSVWWEQFFTAWTGAAHSQNLPRLDTTEIQTHDSLHLPCYPRPEAWQIPLSLSPSVHICPSAQLCHSLERARWPQTCWPHCGGDNEHTAVMPPAHTEVAQPAGPSLLEAEVPAWIIPHSCWEAFWQFALKRQRSPSRAGVPSLEDCLWTKSLVTCKQQTPAQLCPTIQWGPLDNYCRARLLINAPSPGQSLFWEGLWRCACSYSIQRGSFLMYTVCPGTFPLKEFSPAVWKTSKSRHLSSIFRS